jgi:hypothetical protein
MFVLHKSGSKNSLEGLLARGNWEKAGWAKRKRKNRKLLNFSRLQNLTDWKTCEFEPDFVDFSDF